MFTWGVRNSLASFKRWISQQNVTFGFSWLRSATFNHPRIPSNAKYRGASPPTSTPCKVNVNHTQTKKPWIISQGIHVHKSIRRSQRVLFQYLSYLFTEYHPTQCQYVPMTPRLQCMNEARNVNASYYVRRLPYVRRVSGLAESQHETMAMKTLEEQPLGRALHQSCLVFSPLFFILFWFQEPISWSSGPWNLGLNRTQPFQQCHLASASTRQQHFEHRGPLLKRTKLHKAPRKDRKSHRPPRKTKGADHAFVGRSKV